MQLASYMQIAENVTVIAFDDNNIHSSSKCVRVRGMEIILFLICHTSSLIIQTHTHVCTWLFNFFKTVCRPLDL